ncbi:MAG: hypothetical protein JW701_00145 [Kosmotogaceae bacterium]|nr:hypothetical protein [Kosmotogaceae bacterium]
MNCLEVPIMSLIKPKRRRGPKLLWLILVIIVVAAAGAGYVYFTINGVKNSDEMKAGSVDYLFYWQEGADSLYYYLRTSTGGRTSVVTFPVYATIENSKQVLDPQMGAEAIGLIHNWLGIDSNFSYFANLSPDLIDTLTSKLGVDASNPVQLVDVIALRGFKILDYWKIAGYAETFKEYDGSSTMTPRAVAVLLERLGNSSRMAYQLETLTQFPMKISIGVGEESVSRLYLKPDSLDSVKRALSN